MITRLPKVSLLCLVLLPFYVVGVFNEEETEKQMALQSVENQMELHSAIIMNQVTLKQQAEVLKEMLNNTRKDQCSQCYAEGIASSLESLIALKEAAQSLIERNIHNNQRNGCPYPFTEVLHECYYVHPKKLTWLQARKVCQGMGGDLAQPQYPYALQAYLAETYGPSYFWIGATDWVGAAADPQAKDVWRWLSGKHIDPADWLFARPDNLGGDEHCIEIVMSDYPKLFNDETCTVIQRFICQYWRQ